MSEHPAPDRLPAATDPRDIEVLRELTEIGLRLAREVAELATRRITEAKESGWDGNIPADPGAAFARLAQSVRRSIALKARLLEGAPASGRGGSSGEAPFASFGGPIVLDPSFQVSQTPEPTADNLVREAFADVDPPETLAADLGPLTDPRERLIELPPGAAHPHAAEIMRTCGLDPARILPRPNHFAVAPDPADPRNPGEVPLRDWRPSLAPILKVHGWPNPASAPKADVAAFAVREPRLE